MTICLHKMSSILKICLNCIAAINFINEWIGKTISWLTVFMVLTTFIIVVLRYAFDLGWIALQESVAYMHAVVFMLGAAYTLKHNEHVRVDIFYHRCSTQAKAWIDCIGTVCLLMPVCGFILWSSWEYVTNSWVIQESSRNSGGLPGLYFLKTSILLMAGLLILQGISLFLQNLITALGLNTEQT